MTTLRNRFFLFLSVFAVSFLAQAQTDAPAQAFTPEMIEYFETHVRPVLAEHCVSCHGPEKQKSGLRLDSRAALITGGESGPAVAPGSAESSLIYQVLQYSGDVKMPPTGKLDDAALTAIAEWIKMGAPWPSGEIQALSEKDISWPDRFARARESHWAFQPVRQPTPPEVPAEYAGLAPIDRFVVDSLLQNNLSLSPPADRRTLIRRVTFDLHGLPPTPEETAAFINDPDPQAYEKLVDRLLASPRYGERWGRYWLDVARYSDTKGYVFQEERAFPYSYTYRDYVIRAFNEDKPYDQFLKEQLAADQMDLPNKTDLAATGLLGIGRKFVGNIHDQVDDRIDVVTRGMLGLTVSCARCHDHKYDPIPTADYYSLYGVFRSTVEPAVEDLPLIEEPNPEDPGYQNFLAEVANAEASLENLLNDLHVDLLAHAREKAADYLLAAQDAMAIEDTEAFRTLAKDRGLRWQLVDRWRKDLQARAQAADPVFAPWFAFAALPAEGFAEAAAPLAKEINEGTLNGAPVNKRVAAAFKDQPIDSLPKVAECYRAAFANIEKEWMARLAARAQFAAREGKEVDYLAALPDADAEALRLILFGPDCVTNVPRGDVWDLNDVPTQGRIRGARNEIARINASHPSRPDRAMAVKDADKLFDPYIFLRGKPENKGDAVPRQFLGLLSPAERKAYDQSSGRLDLANAIASPDNPLTARVFVNRVWMYHFGQPLVDTPSDFGVRCEPPTHPDLLDYLATEFMANGWSIKHLHRMMLLTETYKQASADRPQLAAVDPENKLLWRQNRQRLDFEAMRDAILAASGDLDDVMGGPSVDITVPPYSTRRSVYSYIERQNLPAVFRTFDFASPDTHSPRRYRTTVPQQALYLMNGEFLIEQARALASRICTSSEDPSARVNTLYELAYQRAPDAEEVALAQAFLEAQAQKMPPDAPVWSYGYGRFSQEERRVLSFTPLPYFGDGTWKGGNAVPDETLGWTMINSGGGHPGNDADHSTILRWTAPEAGVASIKGKLNHPDENGDGVVGAIVSSRHGVHWSAIVFHKEEAARVDAIPVEAGDTIDFIVACGETNAFDSYNWAPDVDLALADGSPRGEWKADADFAGPVPAPIGPWEQYAQVVLMTNEFVFVD